MISTLKRLYKHKHVSGDLEPASRVFGYDRGLPIDRYYIQKFLALNKKDIRGHVLEVGDPNYTLKYGRDVISHVLNPKQINGTAIYGDLGTGNGIPHDMYDCIILTQTLPFIYNIRGVVDSCYDALRADGVLLVTVPGISQISRYDMDRWGDYWRFTSLSLNRLLSEKFKDPQIKSYGNVYAAKCFLEGLSREELTYRQLEHVDPDYEVIIAARCQK